jgi:Tfp pilus assembly protein PilE
MKIQKETVETIKTVVIAVLVTGILAFVAGMKYQNHYSNSVKTEAKNMVSSLKR